MWLCGDCMKVQSWKRPCRPHNGNILNGPFNGRHADFLIHGIDKPQAASNLAEVDASEGSLEPNGLSLELLDSVFQKQFTTTSSIPPPCRLNFSRALKNALDKVLANPSELSSWIQLLLLPICTLNLYIPNNASEARSSTRKKLQIAAINQALLEWGQPNGCIYIIQRLLELFRQNQQLQQQRKQPLREKRHKTNIEACKKKLSDSHCTASIHIMSSDGVTPSNSDTLHELQQKHPPTRAPIIPSDPPSAAAVVVDVQAVVKALRSFPKGTSCGRECLRAQHLLDATSGAAVAVADDLLMSITGVTNLWLSGNCPPELGGYIASAPLTPLLKPGGGLRPITVGTIWRRLCSNGSYICA